MRYWRVFDSTGQNKAAEAERPGNTIDLALIHGAAAGRPSRVIHTASLSTVNWFNMIFDLRSSVTVDRSARC